MTLEEQIQEKQLQLSKLKDALDKIPAGVSSYSVDGESFSYDRAALLREIRALEHDLQALENRGHSRLSPLDISTFYILLFVLIGGAFIV